MARLADIFFDNWYGAYRDLHSFPTRRSSDLAGDTSDELFEDPHVQGRRAVGFGVELRAERKPVVADAFDRLRSEEHTSELQSRLHLVCRLLLEKKKNWLWQEAEDIAEMARLH